MRTLNNEKEKLKRKENQIKTKHYQLQNVE